MSQEIAKKLKKRIFGENRGGGHTIKEYFKNNIFIAYDIQMPQSNEIF